MDTLALARQINAAARLTGSFKLRSGTMATEYFDKYRFEAQPALLAQIAAAMLPLVPAEAQVLAGLEMGGIPIATAMSLQSGQPAAFIRKEPKEYGTCQAVEGGDLKGLKVAMIEDVITTGGAVRDAYQHLLDVGAQPVAVICAIWRADLPFKIKDLDLPVYAALTKADLDAANA